MRCKNCPAYVDAVYYESYEPACGGYCRILDIDHDARCNEDKTGECGCALHYRTIEKMIKENNHES